MTALRQRRRERRDRRRRGAHLHRRLPGRAFLERTRAQPTALEPRRTPLRRGRRPLRPGQRPRPPRRRRGRLRPRRRRGLRGQQLPRAGRVVPQSHRPGPPLDRVPPARDPLQSRRDRRHRDRAGRDPPHRPGRRRRARFPVSVLPRAGDRPRRRRRSRRGGGPLAGRARRALRPLPRPRPPHPGRGAGAPRRAREDPTRSGRRRHPDRPPPLCGPLRAPWRGPRRLGGNPRGRTPSLPRTRRSVTPARNPWPARRPLLALGLAAALSAALAVPAGGVRHRYEIEDFFPEHTAARRAYERACAAFGRDDRTALCVLSLPRPLDAPLLASIDALTRRLEALPEVERVVSPANALLPTRRADGAVVLERAVPAGRSASERRVRRLLALCAEPPYRRALLADDARHALVGAVLRPERLGHADRARVLEALERERTLLAAEGIEAQLTGYPLQRVLLARLAASESRRFLPLAVGATLLLSFLAFRSLASVVLPLAVAAGASLWTTGLMGLLGLPPNIFGPAVYVVVAVVGVTDSVHLLARQQELRSEGLSAAAAAALALREVAAPCAWASLTTALAFASLVTTDIPMIGRMGLQVALGVGSALALTLLLFPACARWLGRDPGARAGRLGRWTERAAVFACRRARGVLCAGAVLALCGLVAAAALRVNSPLLGDLDPAHPLRRANATLAARLGGAVPLDLLLPPPRGAPPFAAYRKERLARVERLTERLRRLPGVLWATSPVDPLRRLAPLLERVPPEDVPGLLPTALLLAHEQVRPWVDARSDTLRIRLRLADLDTEDAFALFERVKALSEEVLGEPVVLTGQGYLAQLANRAIVSEFSTGFCIALLGVSLALLGAFRDPWLACASLPPNLLVVLCALGVMALAGIELRYTSALVLTVVFGLAVDDTIHVVSQLRRLRADPAPLASTLALSGPGLVLSSLLLAGGFAVLLASEFLPLRVMGSLLALSALLALVGDLLLLPALLAARYGGAPPASASPSASSAPRSSSRRS
ncbi:MAG: hypothetical protein D6731_05230 [Planctomycetota bacterium]|nr:MAG: hypothetical protein D6731_05230 [Planctomycetota bacterium]